MHYEVLTIVSPKLTETEVVPVQQTIRDIITAAGATISLEDPIEKKKLAYPIRHEHFGNMFRLECDMEQSAVKTVSDKIKIAEHVLRSEVLKKRIKTAEELAHEAKSKERMARERAEMESTRPSGTGRTPESTRPRAVAPTAPVEPIDATPLNIEELDKKLDELLGGPVDKI